MIKRTSKESMQVQVGAFLVVGILLALAAIFVLGSKAGYFKSQYSLFCYFDDISGLRVGAPIQLAGITVGFVEDISFEERSLVDIVKSVIKPKSDAAEKSDAKKNVQVKLGLKIDASYRHRICTDSVASVVYEGLLGDRIVFLSVGCREKADDIHELNSGDEIVNVQNPTGLPYLVQKGDVLVERGTDLVVDTRVFMANATELVKNLNSVIKEVKEGSGLAHDLVYDAETAKIMKRLRSAADNMDRASADVAAMSADVRRGKGTIGALLTDPSIFNDLKTLFGKVNRNRLVRSVIRYTLETKENQQLK